MWVHLAAAALVIAGAIGFGLRENEWLWVISAIGLVWVAEAFNTAIERLADVVTLNHDARIGAVKDLAAAAVLISALVAALIGAIIFGPHLARFAVLSK